MSTRLIGYARTSTTSQRLELQTEVLEARGCDPIFTDHGRPGTTLRRPGFTAMIEQLRPGDVIMTWRLDRLSRSTRDLRLLLEQFTPLGVTIRTVQESIDTATDEGQVHYGFVAMLADVERRITSQRVRRSQQHAGPYTGKPRGRPRKLTDEQIWEIHERLRTESITRVAIAEELGVTYRTLARYLAA